ncbi:MAG TPA: thermonuclease family protein [Rhizomicrobium sp.]|nr:thermonuclease family protein [Rhizomicrobium sp.]
MYKRGSVILFIIALLFAAILLAPQAASAQGFGLCVGASPQVVQGRVTQVDAGVLVLADGRRAVLEGIRLPQGRLDHAPEEARQAALSLLGAMVSGKDVTLATTPPEKDRHGRLRAQVLIGGAWVQETLLREGRARVALLPGHGECAHAFYAAEDAARSARRGIWALGAYAVRAPDAVTKDLRGTFQIVQGRVVTADVKSRRAFLNFSADWAHDFTVTISPEDMKTFRKRRVKPQLYAGKTVRVRGIIGWYRGPQIELMGPESLVVLP